MNQLLQPLRDQGYQVTPTSAEWLWIFAPLAISLIIAVGIEFKTTRIPNLLILATGTYLLVARIALSRGENWGFLVSLAIAAVIAVGIGWFSGLLPGGVVKLMVAISPALAPWMTFIVTAAPLIALVCLWPMRERFKDTTVPGSLIVAVLTAGLMSVAALAGP